MKFTHKKNKKSKSECKICFDLKKLKSYCTTCKNSMCQACFENQSKRQLSLSSDNSFVTRCPWCRSDVKIPYVVLNKLKKRIFPLLAGLVLNNEIETLLGIFKKYPTFVRIIGCRDSDRNFEESLLHVAATSTESSTVTSDGTRMINTADTKMIDMLINTGCCPFARDDFGRRFYDTIAIESNLRGHLSGYV